jgi:CubicO group peptidase (beta-lactamase class C family)
MARHGGPRKRRLLVLVCAVGLSATALANGRQQPVAQLNRQCMDLNRAGDWAKAAIVAEAATKRVDATDLERAEAWYCLSYARIRLGEHEGAHAAFAELTDALEAIPKEHWLNREAESLKADLTAPDKTSKAPAQKLGQPDVGAMLFEMRRANAEKRFEEAIELGNGALQHPAANHPSIRAEVAMHLYYAHRKQGQQPEANAALDAFRQIQSNLSSDNTLPLQMVMLRHSLGDDVVVERDQPAFEPQPDSFWQHADPADLGMDAEVLKEHETMCLESGADAVLVARHGKIVSEWYSPLYREPVFTMSSVKSITALVAGLLVVDGTLTIDDPVCKFIPEWCDGLKAQVTTRDLLSMTSGLPKLAQGGVGMGGQESMTDMAIAQSPAWAPGTIWAYSNEGAQLLSPILQRAAGMELWKYANERLFVPMGLTQTDFRRDEQGNTNTFADAKTTLREFAKFGALVLNRGRWNGNELVPESWIEQMVSPCKQNAGYGFLWWLYDNPTVWAMEGYLNTSMWAFPELDLVVCRVQSAPYLHASQEYDAKRMFELMVRATKPQ